MRVTYPTCRAVTFQTPGAARKRCQRKSTFQVVSTCAYTCSTPVYTGNICMCCYVISVHVQRKLVCFVKKLVCKLMFFFSKCACVCV